MRKTHNISRGNTTKKFCPQPQTLGQTTRVSLFSLAEPLDFLSYFLNESTNTFYVPGNRCFFQVPLIERAIQKICVLRMQPHSIRQSTILVDLLD